MKRTFSIFLISIILTTAMPLHARAFTFIPTSQELVLTPSSAVLDGSQITLYPAISQENTVTVQSTELLNRSDANLSISFSTNIANAIPGMLDGRYITVNAPPAISMMLVPGNDVYGMKNVTVFISVASILQAYQESGASVISMSIANGPQPAEFDGIAYSLPQPLTFSIRIVDEIMRLQPTPRIIAGSGNTLKSVGGNASVTRSMLESTGCYLVRVNTGVPYKADGPHLDSSVYSLSGMPATKTPGVLHEDGCYVWEATVYCSDLLSEMNAGASQAGLSFMVSNLQTGYAMDPCSVTFVFDQAEAEETVRYVQAPQASQMPAGTAVVAVQPQQPQEVTQGLSGSGELSTYAGQPAATLAPEITTESGVSRNAKIAGVSEFCNVRSGPGTNYPEVGRAYLGETVEMLERKGDWTKCYYNNHASAGWIHSSFLAAP